MNLFSLMILLVSTKASAQPLAGWYVTAQGTQQVPAACSDFCPGNCNERALNSINTPAKIEAVAKSVKNEELECLFTQTYPPVAFPVSFPSIAENLVCEYLPPGTPASCEKGLAGAKRFCCCGTDADCAIGPPAPSPAPTPTPPGPNCSCDDGDICTDDTCAPDGSCIFTPVQCGVNEGCDSFTGLCEDKETIVPCVAVIDEWDGNDYTAEWTEFRTRFPKRSFCLLVPETYIGTLPAGFYNDTLLNPDGIDRTLVKRVVRDYGIPGEYDDWFTLCELDKISPHSLSFIGLFIDTSGSMDLSTVQNSYDGFLRNLSTASLAIVEVKNIYERWIDPFLTTLAP